jgi:hypothetical protein
MRIMINMLHSIFAIGIILFFPLLQGCSSIKPTESLSTIQLDKLPKSLGNIAVTSAKYLPHAELQTPAKGPIKGAGRGAIQMMDNLAVTTNNAAPAFLVVSIVLAPFAAVVGGINGAISADSARSVNEKEAILKKALTEMKIQETMRDQFLKKAVELPSAHFELSGEMGPQSDQNHPDYQALKNKGIDTVYEIAVRELGLESESDVQIYPQLSFYMVVQTRLINIAENKTIAIQPFMCKSRTHNFAYWTSGDAIKFRDEMNQCYDYLARDMVNSF